MTKSCNLQGAPLLDPSSELYASSPMNNRETAWFYERGVPENVLSYPMRLGTDQVVFMDSGRFEFGRLVPRRPSVSAIILPGFDADNCLSDLIAWQLETGMLASWRGKAGALGQDGLSDDNRRDPVVVHSNPLDWLRAGRTGIVFIDAVIQPRAQQFV